MRNKKSFDFDSISKWDEAKMPAEIEDEVLSLYARFTEEGELKWSVMSKFYTELQIGSEWYTLLEPKDLCLEGIDVIDFEKLLDVTYRVLVFMDNAAVIDKQWRLLLQYSGRLQQFPNVTLRKHVMSVKDVQKAAVQVDLDQHIILPMVSWATNGERVFVSYLDFAKVLGKMGLLRY
ncbi:unnamed protein product [Kluyveromyces dobzhanskii CBS 2104]|uniref:WGS project CCBQ000000000 data, contig 00105 n=1 Tax=Kluyveromyces dobzhanskii CBS 2104 TaxID=1427455 RepID=A0A0A8L1D0_9SACH|nr:unnamed protein product [Kluyveromyces dobzhanskii CBS 2104]